MRRLRLATCCRRLGLDLPLLRPPREHARRRLQAT
jgi:hypothetical protein